MGISQSERVAQNTLVMLFTLKHQVEKSNKINTKMLPSHRTETDCPVCLVYKKMIASQAKEIKAHNALLDQIRKMVKGIHA